MRVFIFLMMVFFFSCPSVAKPRNPKHPHLSATKYLRPEYAAIVMRADTGEVLHTAAADHLRHPASLTKMMTLYIVFDQLKSGKLKLTSLIRISHHACKQMPCKLGLRVGQALTLKEAILATVTRSANDVAVALAEKISGSEAAFAHLMTETGKKIGLKNTVFKNASGVPHPGNITTATDMALLSKALINHHPERYVHFNTPSFRFRGQVVKNHNHLLGLGGVDGIKTGLTNASGYNLAASAKRGDIRLITVVMGGPSWQWRDRRVSDLMHTHFKKLGIEPAASGKHASPPYWAKGAVDTAHVYDGKELTQLVTEDPKPPSKNVSFKTPAGFPKHWVRHAPVRKAIKKMTKKVTAKKKKKRKLLRRSV